VQVRTGNFFAVVLAAAALPYPLSAQTASPVSQSLRFNLAPPELTEAAFYPQQTTPPNPNQQNQSVPPPTPHQGPVPALPPYLPQKVQAPSLPPMAPLDRPFPTYSAYDPGAVLPVPDRNGSVYIPVDNWVYPEMVRLYELGYVDSIFLGLRPWTRRSVLRALHKSQNAIMQGDTEEAKGILAALLDELDDENASGIHPRPLVYGAQSAYTRLMDITGTPLRDSYHLGQTLVNDYGRPYQHGFNAIAGLSTVTEAGRFSLYVRAEYQHAPAAAGYSQALANLLSNNDEIGPFAAPNAPQATIPTGPIAAQNPFRIVEANLSYHVLSHEISLGKSDAWIGPAAGAGMAWSNNAEDIYSFRINRVEPLHIPVLSWLIGPVRYDFFYGSLKGHTDPNSPYVHSEAFSFQPTPNVEIGFQRTIIFGGKGHAPVTLHTFLKGFVSTSGTNEAIKFSRSDPGARFSSFHASYRLPLLRHYATFYVDSTVHDDLSPIDAPRRAAYRTGIDISQFPRLHKLEFRVEAASTDPDIKQSSGGGFFYDEVAVQKQGYTNKGFLMGDWIGREAKGGQAWLTWHLAPGEWIQAEYLNKKMPNDFDQGTTQNQFKVSVVKRIGRDYELNAYAQYEGWKAPIYQSGLQKDTTIAGQITWFPKLHTKDLSK
jgi:hypothetical protein